MPDPFRVQFVAGVTPDKWARIWAQRAPDDPLEVSPVADEDQTTGLRDGSVSMVLLRLPIDRSGLHVIPLYTEVPVVVVAKDHPAAAFDELDVADLATEPLLQPPDAVPEWRDLAPDALREQALALPSMTTKQAVEVAATGSGIVVVPMSVARLNHRRDVVSRPVTGVAASQIGLAWRVDDDDPRIERFIGVVRGRTERSTRGGTDAAAAADPPATKSRAPDRGRGSQGRAKASGAPRRAGPQRGRRRK